MKNNERKYNSKIKRQISDKKQCESNEKKYNKKLESKLDRENSERK